jgi:hypothetical protein
MNRRTFLKKALISASVLDTAAVGTGILFLYNHKNILAPQRPGKIPLDFHAHLLEQDAWKNCDELLKVLSRGITALTTDGRRKSHLLSYEKALIIPGLKDHIREIDKGLFASVEYNGQVGYILRNQEIFSKYHLLAAPTDDYFWFDEKHLANPDYVVEMIKKKGSYCAVAHIMLREVLENPVYKRWHIITPEERKEVTRIAKHTDGVEVSSSFTINLIWGFAWFEKAKALAKEMAKEQGLIALVNSDAHEALGQVQTSVMYLEDQGRGQCFEKVINALKQGKFETYEQSLSRISVLSALIENLKRE